MPPKVSINLCCYNGEQFLEETLQSIFLQTYKDWELVVVNDGSTDSTERIIKSHITAGKPIVYHYQENAGLGSARNKALQLSRGEYLALIDQDDIWLPEKLEKQVRVLDADPALGLVYSDSYYIDRATTVLGTAFKRASPPQRDPFIALLTGKNFIPCLTVLMRKECVLSVGAFNTTLKYVEDYDLFLKLALHSKVSCICEPLAKYRFHAGNLGGAGHPDMTREALFVLGQFAKQSEALSRVGLQRMRWRKVSLWGKLIVQSVRYGDVSGLFHYALSGHA